jgi:hypothetical protein
MSVASATATFVGTALPPLLLTWRCVGCRRIVAKLTYDMTTIIEVRHHCRGNPMNRLPDHADRLSVEGERG